LGALDDLIEVNRKLIADLVDTVDAAFTQTFGARPLALLVGDLAKVIDCLHSKKPEQEASGRLYLQLNNVLDNGLLSLDSTYLIDPADYQKWTRNIEATEWDCVITNVGRVGAVARIPANVQAALGRNMTGIRPKMAEVDGAFIATALRSSPVRREIALKTDSGTILDALNVKNIAGLRLPMCDEPERQAFQGIAGPMLRAADELMVEIRDLRATRDELLPLLMSGRARVGDFAS
jgi:type I restriction enzyme S subunit